MFREWFRTHYDHLWLQYLENAPAQYPLVQWVEHNHPEVWGEYKLETVPQRVLGSLLKGNEVKINGVVYCNDTDLAYSDPLYPIRFDQMTIQKFIDLSLQMTAQEIEELIWLS